MNSKKTAAIVWVPLAVAVALIGGILLGQLIHSNAGASKTEHKLSTILKMVKNDYVDVVDIDSLLEAMLPDLMVSLDPHSSYIPAQDLTSFNEGLDGTLSGVGVTFTMNNDTVSIVEIVSGGPAQRAGLKIGRAHV